MCCFFFFFFVFFFQAEDGIRDSVASRGLGDVYKRQEYETSVPREGEYELDPSVVWSATKEVIQESKNSLRKMCWPSVFHRSVKRLLPLMLSLIHI